MYYKSTTLDARRQCNRRGLQRKWAPSIQHTVTKKNYLIVICFITQQMFRITMKHKYTTSVIFKNLRIHAHKIDALLRPIARSNDIYVSFICFQVVLLSWNYWQQCVLTPSRIWSLEFKSSVYTIRQQTSARIRCDQFCSSLHYILPCSYNLIQSYNLPIWTIVQIHL